VHFDLIFVFWCFAPLSAIFQLYHGDQFARCVGEVEDMPTRAATDERKKVVEQDIITEIL
jgi:hypothetical protein